VEKFNLKSIEISDIYENLPKTTFTLAEWINFVEENPHYLTINETKSDKSKTKIKAITLAITKGLENIKEAIKPLEILQQKLERSNIVEQQKKEFSKIYITCLASNNFEATIIDESQQENQYKLVSDLLMIKKGFYKIIIPPSMVGLLLSHTHLLGHKGLQRMMADLESYYFPNMTTTVRKFVQCCYACFLTNKSNRKTKIGIYPTPNYPFEEITMDIAENLNTINGFSHLLITQCILTDFTIIIPLKSKTSTEIVRVFMNSLFQQFNIFKIHTDNGPGFRSNDWLELMAALNIQIIASSALHPSGRGQVERLVQTIKTMLKRMLATKPDFNWEFLPYLCSKILNSSISPKTGFTPQEMVFGTKGQNNLMFGPLKQQYLHPQISNKKEVVEQLNRDIEHMVNSAKEKLQEAKIITNERLNKNRTDKNFKIGDYVFVLDRLNIAGNTRPLKTKFHPSPYVVVKPLWTTTLVKRIADGYMTLYSNDDIKKYEGKSPLFKDLPVEITRILLHDFKDLLESELLEIIRNDTLELPQGIELFQEESTFAENKEMADQEPEILADLSEENILDEKHQLPPDELTPAVNTQEGENQTNNVELNINDVEMADDTTNDSNPDAIEDLNRPDLIQDLAELDKAEEINDTLNDHENGDKQENTKDDSSSESEEESLTIEPPGLLNNPRRSGRKVTFNRKYLD